jgi:uncharacterized membrane protein YhaH (DUF805 family)
MFGFGLPELTIVFIIFLILIVPTYFVAKVLNKAGFSRWYSLLSLIPIVNITCLWLFAFIEWPNES